MRIVRQDITGATDANGNATIPVKLPSTGEWRNLKFALSMATPAEWAIVVSGTPVTYGRGRRVTLGPELIQDGETIQVQVTGAAPAQQIAGSANGISGAVEEILASYAPQPNTIAMDTAVSRQELAPDGLTFVPRLSGAGTCSFTVAAGATTPTLHFTLPAGTVEVRVMADAGGQAFTYDLFIAGQQSGVQYFGQPLAPGAAQTVQVPTAPLTLQVESSKDSQLVLVLHNTGAVGMDVYVAALFDVENPGQIVQGVQSVTMFAPQAWQAASSSFYGFASGATTVILAGVAGQRYRIWAPFVDVLTAGAAGNQVSVQDTNAASIAQMGAAATRTVGGGHVSVPLGIGAGLQILAQGTALGQVAGGDSLSSQ